MKLKNFIIKLQDLAHQSYVNGKKIMKGEGNTHLKAFIVVSLVYIALKYIADIVSLIPYVISFAFLGLLIQGIYTREQEKSQE